MPSGVNGIIEGFYGRPWTWDERIDVMRWCHARGMTHYVYAPKDDPLHRERWREPYGSETLDGFGRLLADGGLQVGFAISPGLSINYGEPAERAALATKIDQVVDIGINLVCLALDDIPARPGLGDDHADLTRWLRDHLADRADLLLVPTEYTGTVATPYLDALASGVPDDVPIAWTGTTVVCDTITIAEARARADALGGRPPLVWDNYPVNDAMMSDRLFMGPLRGREQGLSDHCDGYLANPMVQPGASKLPLSSIAAFVTGGDPIEAWEADAGEWRTFAEACDGELPNDLVGAVVASFDATDVRGEASLEARAALRAWLEAAGHCSAPGLEHEVDRWIEQVHREADVGLLAVRVLERLKPDPSAALEPALLLAMTWQQARRADVTVMGPRIGLRPVISQDDQGAWVFHRGTVVEDRNAIDRLVRFALDALAARTDPRLAT